LQDRAGDQKGGFEWAPQIRSENRRAKDLIQTPHLRLQNMPTLHGMDKPLMLGTRTERRETHTEAKLTQTSKPEKTEQKTERKRAKWENTKREGLVAQKLT